MVDAPEACKAVRDTDAVHDEPAEGLGGSVSSVAAALAESHREREETSVGEVVEREVVGCRRRAGAPCTELFLVQKTGLGGVRHVEELEKDAVEVGEVTVVVGVEPDGEEMGSVDPVQVRREAWDLELAEDDRVGRIVERSSTKSGSAFLKVTT